jgi:beta-mannosidase
LTVPIDALLAGKNPKGVVLLTEVLVGGKEVSRNEHFFRAYKDLLLPRPQITTDVVAVRGGFRISLSADKLARAVYLSAADYPGFFADNYFDLIPGRKFEVEFRSAGAVTLSDFRKQLRVRSLADAF